MAEYATASRPHRDRDASSHFNRSNIDSEGGNLFYSVARPIPMRAAASATRPPVARSASHRKRRSKSGGMSIALAATSDWFIKNATAAHIPLEVLHRVVAMASGGMDTLPHNGAVITLLPVTGRTHKESYRDTFAVTLIKTLAVFFVIGAYYTTGIV
jgi:hypothetical protein